MHLWRRLVIALGAGTLIAGCTVAPAAGVPGPAFGPASGGASGPASTAPTVGTRSTVGTGAAGRAAPRATAGTATRPTTSRSTASRSSPARSSAAGSRCAGSHCYSVGAVHQLPVGVAPESSGIVASSRRAGVYFVVDDGTGTQEIQAVDTRGRLVATVGVRQMSARNAEALAAGPCGTATGRCLYIGDIGDNDAHRADIVLYRIAEPDLSPAPASPVASEIWRYTYPDGAHNAESLMVAEDRSVVIVTKSAPDPTTGLVAPHRIYRGSPGGGRLQYVSSFRPPDPARRVQSLFTGTVVTDAAYSSGRVLLLTYDEVVEYVAPREGAPLTSFPTWPHRELPDPPMIQTEGIATELSGCGYQVTSEEGPDGMRAGLAGVNCS